MSSDDQLNLLIGGALVRCDSAFAVTNPSTGASFAQCADCSPENCSAAVTAAADAGPGWALLSLSERKATMEAAKAAVIAAKDTLAPLLVKEQGKPLAQAQGEIDGLVFVLQKCIDMELPEDVYSETDDRRVVSVRRPIGVVACICPWNYPLFTSVQKWAPALTIGNTAVVKPSPFTPLTTLALAVALKDVFPPGVLNVIAGADGRPDGFNVGAALTTHPLVRKVSFTGSTATGKAINACSAPDLKRVTLECGGNDAAIVRADADVAAAAKGIFGSAFANSGQLCCAAKRVFVHEAVLEAFKAETVKLANAAVFGDGLTCEGVTHGPINNKMQYDRVSELVEDARSCGAEVLCGGQRLQGSPEEAFFYAPTIIAGVAEGVRVVDEEQFGPVMPILSFSEDAEAVRRANDSMFGLGGSVWGSDLEGANKLAMLLEAGTVWVNQHSDMTGAPFGGFKWSGVGRELGKSDIDAFSELQTLSLAK